MIFDSLGLGELGVIFILILVLVDPKQVGKFLRGFTTFKKKVYQIQNEVKQQIDSLTNLEGLKDQAMETQVAKSRMRKWGRERVRELTAAQRAEASVSILRAMEAWDVFKEAKVISCFFGGIEEVDTDPLLKKILSDGKTLLLPYLRVEETKETPLTRKSLGMARVEDLEKDLIEGHFRIPEPLPSLRLLPSPEPDLILIPGTCFDLQGGRIGKGHGYYDAYLEGRAALKAGLCFDAQVAGKKLPLESHDRNMDMVITEKRIITVGVASTHGVTGKNPE